METQWALLWQLEGQSCWSWLPSLLVQVLCHLHRLQYPLVSWEVMQEPDCQPKWEAGWGSSEPCLHAKLRRPVTLAQGQGQMVSVAA